MITGFVDFGQQSLDERFSALKEQCIKNKLLSERTVATHRKRKEMPDLSPLCQPLPKRTCRRSIKFT